MSFVTFRRIDSSHLFVKARRITIVIALCFSVGAAGSPHEKLQALGFTLLQGTPVDFEASTLDGKRRALSSYKGNWIWLAFWATWCGPCTEEIPALEALYRRYKSQGLMVVGVSVDEARASAETFAKEHSLTFPVLHDDSGSAASKYQATALPTVYVISPDWKLAGVLRGAREWSSPETLQQIEALLPVKKYKEPSAGVKMTEQGGAVELPNNLAPPQLEATFESKFIQKGDNVPFTVNVTWKGNPKEYLVKVPKVTLPEGITQGEVASSSSSDSESHVLKYHFPLKVAKEGTQKIGPIELAYSPRAGGKELFSRIEGVVIEVQKDTLPKFLLPIIAALGFFVMGGIFWAMRRRRVKQSSSLPEQPRWDGLYENIRQMKMRGEKSQYMASLLKLSVQVSQTGGARDPVLVSLLEKIQFAGYVPSDVELTSLEKKIEKVIKEKESE